MKWTLDSLERACRKLLVTRTSIAIKELRGIDSAGAEWEPGGKVRTTVDGFSVSMIHGVVHELLHVVLEEELRPFEEYGRDSRGQVIREPAELAIGAWEEAIAKLILNSRRRRTWWRTAIAARIGRK
jgi:hypothetical protein